MYRHAYIIQGPEVIFGLYNRERAHNAYNLYYCVTICRPLSTLKSFYIIVYYQLKFEDKNDW